MNKFLVLGLFLLAVVSTMAVISAETTVEQNITLDGVQFKIPDGYNAVERSAGAKDNSNDTEDIDGTPIDTEVSSEYKNAAGDELELKVGARDNQKIESINLANSEKKNIAGKDGYLVKEVDDGKDKYKFEYLQDGISQNYRCQ